MIVEAPWPLLIHAHRSPFSAPLPDSQPLPAPGSVRVSAYSCPPTIVTPSVAPLTPLEPVATKLAPQEAPASLTYGMLVNGRSLPLTVATSWYAQYCVPKPLGFTPCGASTTICTLSPDTPKCPAARTASARLWLALGRLGAATPRSAQGPLTGLADGGPTFGPALPNG